MKAFITGATGHIGSSLTQVLLEKGFEVHCLVRETSDLTFLKSLNSKKLFLSKGDITSPESLLEGIKNAQPDYVFHVAAALGRWAPWKYFYDLNVLGTRFVVEAIEKVTSVKKLLHVSTFAVYGYEDRLDTKEDQSYGKVHYSYSKTKMMAEKYLWEKYDKGKGLPLSIIRPPSVFGPNDRRNLNEIIELIKKDRMLVPGKGTQLNSWAYTYDIADLLIKMAENDKATGEAFNVKTGDITSKELLIKLMTLLGIEDKKIRSIPIWVARVAGVLGSAYGSIFKRKTGPLIQRQIIRMVIHHHACNIEKAKNLLDWSPRLSLDDALKDTIDWFIKSGTFDSL